MYCRASSAADAIGSPGMVSPWKRTVAMPLSSDAPLPNFAYITRSVPKPVEGVFTFNIAARPNPVCVFSS